MTTLRSVDKRRVQRRQPKKPDAEFEEFGPGKKDIIICPQCSCVYYYKSWHHSAENYPHLHEDKGVFFKVCPACGMKAQHEWEGELRITGIPQDRIEEVMHCVGHSAELAFENDPMDRVLEVVYEKNVLLLHTSENQLVVRIAKKCASAFKKNLTKPLIHKGKGEDPFVITMGWLK